MIVFRCLECSMKNLSIEVLGCPFCGGINFAGEYYNESRAEPRVQPSHFFDESIESNSEAKYTFLINSSNSHDQNDSIWEGFVCSFKGSYECEKTYFESHEIVSADSTFACNPTSHLKEESLKHFCPNPVVKKMILSETENSYAQAYSLNRQNHDNCYPSSSSYLWDPLCPSTAERQHLINVPHELPSSECKIQPSVEMTTEKHTITESSGIYGVDGKMGFTGSTHFEQQKVMLQSFRKSETTQKKLTYACDEENSYCLDLLSKTRNFSSQNFRFQGLESMYEAPQQKVQSLEQQTREKGPESGFSNDISGADLKSIFRCQNCPRWFKNKSILNFHEQNNCDPKPYKCDKCPKKFHYESLLIIHHLVHTKEKPFKCNICSYATKWAKKYETTYAEISWE